MLQWHFFNRILKKEYFNDDVSGDDPKKSHIKAKLKPLQNFPVLSTCEIKDSSCRTITQELMTGLTSLIIT
jgi:hypothetical protein